MRKKGRSFDLIVQTVPFQAITDCLPRYFTKPMPHPTEKRGMLPAQLVSIFSDASRRSDFLFRL